MRDVYPPEAEFWHIPCFYYKQEDEAAMVRDKSKDSPSVPAIAIGFSERARRFFFETLSARYGDLGWRSKKEEIFLGYESSWPASYKKLHR
jgi:hypothetical protein